MPNKQKLNTASRKLLTSNSYHFSDALFGMKADTGDLKESLNSVRGVVDPIRKELQEEGEAKYLKEVNDYLEELERLRQKRPNATKEEMVAMETPEQVENKYSQKLEYRCQGMLNRASSKCRSTFSRLYDTCWDKLHWSVNWALCWPLKLTFICNFASTMGDSCEPGKHVPPGYGRGFVSLNDTQNQMKGQFQDVRMQYKVAKFVKVPQSVKDTFDSSSELLAKFTEKKNFVDFILWFVVKCVLAYSFRRVLLKSEEYQRLYLEDIQYDNNYITDYFRKIDNRRRMQFKQTLLPLKKIEKKKFIDPYSFSIDWKEIGSPLIKLFLETVPITFFIIVDYVFYETLDLIRRHSHIEYTQVGHHNLSFKVKGTGMIAALVRSVIKGNYVKCGRAN
uniref:DC-STAMP domain-containing protein 1 n=2 Tax=Cacopsylla melanoneura TaxID=428564 RepID=A0A8D8RE87_9HEMI